MDRQRAIRTGRLSDDEFRAMTYKRDGSNRSMKRTMNPYKLLREGSGILQWDIRYLMNIGIFSAMALVVVLPTGAGGGLVLLICSTIYLIHCRHQHDSRIFAKYEFWFLGSMVLYPLAVVVNSIAFVEPISGRYFDNPSRFLLALPIYWAIRKSQIMPDALVMGASVGAAGAGVLAIYQWAIHDHVNGFTNPIPFSQITALLICIASIPVSISRIWRRIRIVGVVLGIIAVYLSDILGAWIGIPIILWLAMEWFPGKNGKSRWRLILAVVSIAGLLLFFFQDRINPATNEDIWNWKDIIESDSFASTACRLELWRAGWRFSTEHPWFGIGFGQYGTRARELQKKDPESFATCVRRGYPRLAHAHNDFIEIAATMGRPSILTYLIPLILIYGIGHHCCRRRVNDMGVILKIYAASQGIFSLTQSQFNHNISTTFFAFTAVSLVALACNLMEHRKQ